MTNDISALDIELIVNAFEKRHLSFPSVNFFPAACGPIAWINFRRNNEVKFKERRKGPCIK